MIKYTKIVSRLFHFLGCALLFNFSQGQEETYEINFGAYRQTFDKPLYELIDQKASNGKKTGSYKQVINASNTTLSAGDILELNYYISGYGYIDFTSAKLYYSASAHIAHLEESYYLDGFQLIDKKIGYGGAEMPMQNSGLIPLSAVLFDSEVGFTKTYFDDFVHASPEKRFLEPRKKMNNHLDDFEKESTQKNSNQTNRKTGISKSANNHRMHYRHALEHTVILSETTLGSSNEGEFVSPVSFKIKLKNDVEPGEYYYTFILTYFNGNLWQNDRVEIKFKVMPWYEEYSSLIQWLALLIAILTIITLVGPTFKIFITLNKYFIKKFASKISLEEEQKVNAIMESSAKKKGKKKIIEKTSNEDKKK
ncbi:hypothetical protein FGM00_15985 [Aggregatimonas sangjinii]|uniref:Uncharacterized protein n=1 Tax=Aggregatimonas sangjinii TaxID=2583587 RepID=A0A5B7STK2_9FLAO|nr:hypothetical protein [Aggregatimonas sangjinii]QCX01532.1 hypothetical protein FGM00_15985 [Aggregatimonas sangjinii]